MAEKEKIRLEIEQERIPEDSRKELCGVLWKAQKEWAGNLILKHLAS